MASIHQNVFQKTTDTFRRRPVYERSFLYFEQTGFMSTTCSESVASIWIDDPIILPETEPVSVLNVASLEDCQELCLDELDDTCSLVRFSNGNNCTMYNASEVFRSTIISPVSNAEMLSTRICMLGKLYV